MIDERFIPLEEVAAQTKMKPRTIIGWIRRKRLKAFNPSRGVYLVYRASWENFVQSKTLNKHLPA